MPPLMPNPSKRMTANPAKPVARYRPGKVLYEETSSSSSEGDTSEAENKTKPTSKKLPPKASSFPTGAPHRQVEPHKFKRADQEAEEDEEGFVTEEEDEDESGGVALNATEHHITSYRDNPKAQVAAVPRAVGSPRPKPTSEEYESEGSDGTSEEESETEEESSSEDEPQRKFQRPTFVKKSDRGTTAASTRDTTGGVVRDGKISTSSSFFSDQAEQVRRKEMAEQMIKDKLERDAAARAAGRRGWDDDDEVATEDMVDDTDGQNPEAEYAAWKLRELTRLKLHREVIERREKEIEEIERRRNLTQEEREAEDRDYLDQQKEEREEGKGKAGFMQRYHHKGVFFQDDSTAEILRKRDLMGAKFVDEVQNREVLPQYMQIRDMSKLGKKGRTRYKDLRGEDTGHWGQVFDERRRGKPRVASDVDERFRPDHDIVQKGPTGANASTIQNMRERNIDNAPDNPRAMRNGDRNTKPGASSRDVYEARKSSPESRSCPSERHGRRNSSLGQPESSRRSRSRSRGSYGNQDRHGEGRNRRKRSRSLGRNDEKRRRVKPS